MSKMAAKLYTGVWVICLLGVTVVVIMGLTRSGPFTPSTTTSIAPVIISPVDDVFCKGWVDGFVYAARVTVQQYGEPDPGPAPTRYMEELFALCQSNRRE